MKDTNGSTKGENEETYSLMISPEGQELLDEFVTELLIEHHMTAREPFTKSFFVSVYQHPTEKELICVLSDKGKAEVLICTIREAMKAQWDNRPKH